MRQFKWHSMIHIVLLMTIVLFTCGANGGGCDGGGGANTIYVDGAFTGIEQGTRNQPYRSVSTAITHASPGYTIDVAPGIYREHIQLKEGVTLVSRKVGAAVLHGGANRNGGYATVNGANNAEIKGFAITGGYTGIHCDGTSPTITRNLIFANYGDGGIVCLNNSQAMILNNTILGNLGNSTNGLSAGVYAERATPTIMNNIITGNSFGYAPYQCNPVESYNNIWGNRRNYGYDASGGTGTISQDPVFQYRINNTLNHSNDWDYRLSAASPCRNAGNPAAQYNDADGSRNDMGAFDGNGGYSMSLPAQEYFIESVLNAIDTNEGPRINGTSRFTSNPVFWFDATGSGHQGETDARNIIDAIVPTLTNHLYHATYHTGAQPPVNLCQVITVTFDSPRGVCFRQGVNAQCRDTDSLLERNGAAIIGGELHLHSSWIAGFAANSSAVETLKHELGHVFGLSHSYRGDHIIGQGVGCCLGRFSAIATEAFGVLYSQPAGTSLEDLIELGKIGYNAMHPFPVIDGIQKNTGGPGWPWSDTISARVGDVLLLQGSRLTLRWLTEPRVTVLPPDHMPPDVYFGNIRVTADLTDQTTIAGNPARALKVTVPVGAKSDWVWVKTRDLESLPIYLEILP